MFYVYVLRSIKYNRFYTGSTDNLEKRLKEHNSGKTKSIKAFIPWEIIYKEEYLTREEAVMREKYLKSGFGREFLYKIKINAPVAQQDRATVS
ncbi:MAG: GIY-YIG nuclease family protein [Bacillota bacterium]